MSSSSRRSAPLAPGIAFITGGARGLGNAIAVSFAKEGSKGIVLVDVADEKGFEAGKKKVEAYGVEVLTITADVTSEPQIQSAIAQTIQKFSRIDYAVNFAGIAGPLAPLTDISVEDYQRVLNVNTTGVWLCMKHQLTQMQTQPLFSEDGIAAEEGGSVQTGLRGQKGAIVNAASVNSILAGKGTSGYTSAKHAVVGMTKAAALEAREVGVRVNCVSPGFLRTELLGSGFLSARPGEGETKVPMERWEGFEKRQGRRAGFEEIGDVVVALCSTRFSLVNGHNLVIDGGFTIDEDNY